jgi:hypothetical protein
MYKNSDIIKAACNDILSKKGGSGCYPVFLSDSTYYLPALNEFINYLQHSNRISISPDNPISGTEGFDCDDYAFIQKGHVNLFNRDVAKKTASWAVGIIWGKFSWVPGLHATNWIATSDKGLLLYEPQQYLNGIHGFDECLGDIRLMLL